MLDTINFIDLISLSRIGPDSTVERFGGLINSSFFDASNILGSLKQKGLVDFVTSFPSQSALSVTDSGKQLIEEAQAKSKLNFDTLDMAIIVEISAGKRTLPDLGSVVNVTPKDLAMHLYKLSQQQYASYELRNGNVSISLTEKGFLAVKEGMPKQTTQATQSSQTDVADDQEIMAGMESKDESPQAMEDYQNIQSMAQSHAQQAPGPGQPSQPQQPGRPKTADELMQLEAKIMGDRKSRGILTFVVIIIAVVILLVLFLTGII